MQGAISVIVDSVFCYSKTKIIMLLFYGNNKII